MWEKTQYPITSTNGNNLACQNIYKYTRNQNESKSNCIVYGNNQNSKCDELSGFILCNARLRVTK